MFRNLKCTVRESPPGWKVGCEGVSVESGFPSHSVAGLLSAHVDCKSYPHSAKAAYTLDMCFKIYRSYLLESI